MTKTKLGCAILAALLLASCNEDKDECKTECVGNVAYSCVNDVQETKDCGTGGCISGACIDAVVCTENAMQCSAAGVPQKCVGNKWVDQKPCGKTQTCKGAGNCENNNTTVCTENDMQCSETGVPQKCVGNKWVDQSPCGTNQTCKGKGSCEDNNTNTKTSCGPNDEAICQLRDDGHIWAVACFDGSPVDDDFNEDCTAQGLPCSIVQVRDNFGTYDEAQCACTKDTDCSGSTPYCDTGSKACVECKKESHCSGKPGTTCKSGVCSGNVVTQPDCTGIEQGDICQTDTSGNSWLVVCVEGLVIYDDGYDYHITKNCTQLHKRCVESGGSASCQ